MRKSSAFPLVAVLLVIAAALVLLQAANAQIPSRPETGTSAARSTVRSYYAAVETYLQTGDLSGVTSVFESGDDATELEWRLRALRANYLQISIDVVDMSVTGEIVTAEITVDAGPDAARLPIQPLQHLRSWSAREVFQVQGNLVVAHSTVGPGLGLFVPQGSVSVDRRPSGGMTLHAARLTFPRGMDSYVALPAPALVTVESGIIEVQGNGAATLVPVYGGASEKLEPGTVARAESNDALITGNARLVMRNVSESQSTLIVAMLAPSLDRPPVEAEHTQHRPGVGLDSLSANGVLVDPLGSLQLPEKPIDHMLGGWIVLEAGASATLHERGNIPHVIPFIGQPVVQWDASPGQPSISNPGLDQIVVWAVFIS